MAQQTAVEWLALRYHHRQGYLSQDDIAEAISMEKEHIRMAFENGEHNIDPVGNLIEIEGAEQYYNETYGK